MAGLKEETPFCPCCSVSVPRSQSASASSPSSSISSVGSYVVAGDWYRLVYSGITSSNQPEPDQQASKQAQFPNPIIPRR